MTVAPCRPRERITIDAEGRLSGRAGGVPFAGEAEHIAVLADDGTSQHIALVQSEHCRLGEGHNLAGDRAGHCYVRAGQAVACCAAPPGFDQHSLMLMGSAIRSVETAGALETILSL